MNKFMAAAIEEGRKGMRKGDGGPFGAVIVRKGKIFAKGHNMVLVTNDPTMHAEVTAIRNAAKKAGRFDLSDCEIYTSCEPCPMCFGAIHWAKMRRMHYGCTSKDAANIGFDDKWIYDVIKKPGRGLRAKNIDRKECIELFKEWKRKQDRKMY